jgi:methionyl-tRNA synthetase
MLSRDEIRRLDVRVGEIIAASSMPEFPGMLKLTLDMGLEEVTAVAELAGCYEAERLIGRQLLVLANVEPVDYGGVVSQAVVLGHCTGDRSESFLSMVDRRVPNGTRLHLE